MNNLKVNRQHFINPNNIKKIVVDKENIYVHLKKGYPKIIKSDESLDLFRLRFTNAGLVLKDFEFGNE